MLVVFDWDGTLADSKANIVGCLRASIADLGAQERSEPELTSVIGLGLPETVQQLYPDADGRFVDAFVAAYRTRWLTPRPPAARLFEGVRETVDALRERGIAVAVATGKSRAGLDRELAETELTTRFVATRCADETRSKPHPQMLLELLAVTNTSPADAVMVGDSQWDLRMASAASIRAVAVGYGTEPLSSLRAHDPWRTINALPELLDLLDG